MNRAARKGREREQRRKRLRFRERPVSTIAGMRNLIVRALRAGFSRAQAEEAKRWEDFIIHGDPRAEAPRGILYAESTK